MTSTIIARGDAPVILELLKKPLYQITRFVYVLVVGTQNPHALRPGATQSSKERKAAELRADGQEIEIMGEDDFVALVSDLAAGGDRGAPRV